MSADPAGEQSEEGDSEGDQPPDSPPLHVEARPRGRRLLTLSLLALGVVYGDIGTSPLYALRECFSEQYGLEVTRGNVLGILSLILWSLILVVSVKYLLLVMRADNRGEGGVLALMALNLQRLHRGSDRRVRAVIVALGLVGAALLYGDGMITPAISVLSAMEGISVYAPAFYYAVIPLTIAILVTLFSFQKHGTRGIGRIFGPVTLAWFATIGILGLIEIVAEPQTLQAASPYWAVLFFREHGRLAFLVLGSVFLVVTGSEALYADMGHFGKRPIRVAWFTVAFPALVLNYFGQGALILREPAAVANPFYLIAPDFFRYPLLAMATAATIIASQALISGSFSLTRQLVQLGYAPRVRIVHTSESEFGQIYVPAVNWALMIGCILIVVGFGSSSRIGHAYGIAVSGTFAITTVLLFVLMRSRWQWSLTRALTVAGALMVIDVAFLGANSMKLFTGGWVPLVIGAGIFLLMTTWYRGRRIVGALLNRATLPLDLFLPDIARHQPMRVPGVAVFLTADPTGVPGVLLHHLKHNKTLHDRVVLLSVLSTEVPEVSEEGKVTVEELGQGFYRIKALFGFMETPDVGQIMRLAAVAGFSATANETSYFLARERILPTGRGPMAGWRKRVYIVMHRNSPSAAEFFGIPPNRAVELGAQFEM
jgi:KUP system potassium uptake protein